MRTIDQRFLTPEVVQKITNLSEESIQELMEEGQFPALIELEGTKVFDCQEVLNYIADEIHESNHAKISDFIFDSI